MASRKPPQSPIVFDATPSSLLEDTQVIIDTTNRVWDAIAANVRPEEATFENTIQPIIDDENARIAKSRLLKFYASTSPSKDLRDASNKATTLLNNSDVDVLSRPDVFRLVEAVAKNTTTTTTTLTNQSRHYVRKLHRKMLMNGCAIADPAAKTAFDETNKRVKDLARQCTTNFEEDRSGIWLAPEELDGVPADFVAKMEKGSPGGENEGKLWLRTKIANRPSTVVTHARSAATRRKVYRAVRNRLPQNVPLFRELILARDALARLLGFPSYLAFKTAQKMVRTPETVTDMVGRIKERLQPAAWELVGELAAIKRERMMEGGGGGEADSDRVGDASDDPTKIFFWDESYYSKIWEERENEKKKKEEEGKETSDSATAVVPPDEYFEVYNTLEQALRVYGVIFDVLFERVTQEPGEDKPPLVWHEDVLMYAVWDTRATPNSFLGYAYFDLFPRDGKYGHRGCYAIQRGYHNPDGSYFHPSCAFVMNYPKPAPTKPTLLSLWAVSKMLHELGHLLQTLLGRVEHADLGFVDFDFGEAPCIMLEHLIDHPAILRELSHHYSYLSSEHRDAWVAKNHHPDSDSEGEKEKQKQPPIKLPLDAISKSSLLNPDSRTKRKDAVNTQIFNLFMAAYDIRVHGPADRVELEAMDLAEELNRMHAEITGMHGGEALGEGWGWAQGQSVFRMIVGGYDAGYYTYLLCRVYSLDMYEAGGFETAKTLDEMKAAGRRFRDTILAVAGSRPEMVTLTEYLGREPRMEPYFAWLGI